MSNNEKVDIFNQWLDKAMEDIMAASILMEHETPLTFPVCFHCQQAVEKLLKGFLLFHDWELIKTHNLNFLKEECLKFDKSFEGFDFVDLNQFTMTGRYPGPFGSLPTVNDAKQFIQLAKEVKELILSKISLNN